METNLLFKTTLYSTCNSQNDVIVKIVTIQKLIKLHSGLNEEQQS